MHMYNFLHLYHENVLEGMSYGLQLLDDALSLRLFRGPRIQVYYPDTLTRPVRFSVVISRVNRARLHCFRLGPDVRYRY